MDLLPVPNTASVPDSVSHCCSDMDSLTGVLVANLGFLARMFQTFRRESLIAKKDTAWQHLSNLYRVLDAEPAMWWGHPALQATVLELLGELPARTDPDGAVSSVASVVPHDEELVSASKRRVQRLATSADSTSQQPPALLALFTSLSGCP